MTDKYYYEYDEVERVWSVYENFPENSLYDSHSVHCFDCAAEADARVAVSTLNMYMEALNER